MARPRKDTVDYFPHDKDMRDDPKIKAVRTKFGLSGYAIWSMFLEVLCDSDNLEIEDSEISIALIAGDFGVSEAEMKGVLDFCFRLKLLQQNNGKIFCLNLKKRLQQVFDKREKLRVKYRKKYNSTVVSEAEIRDDVENSEEEITQSKVKESKIESKVNNIIDLSNSLFITEGFEISKQDFNAINLIGNTIIEFGEEKVIKAIKKAEEVWYHNKRMAPNCHWKKLFRYHNIQDLYDQSKLKLPDEESHQKTSRGNNEMPEEFR